MQRFRNLPTYYKVSLGLFVLAIVAFVASAVVGASQLSTAFEQAKAADSTEVITAPARDTDVPTKSSTAEVSRTSDPTPVQANTPSQTPPLQAPVQAKEQGAHIPFTSQPVTPGDPESYVDTVGQCPFYEMAGEKGCVPPPDLTCNADWSYCEPTTKNTNQED